jgi:hypothetical protein
MLSGFRPLLIGAALVLAGCQPPNPDRYVVSDGSPIEIQLPKLFADGKPVVQYEVTDPAQGSLLMIGTQATYTPVAGASNEDRFRYRLFDGQDWREEGKVIVELPKTPAILDDSLRLDQIAMRGTHNSYHVLPPTLAHPTHNYTQPPVYEQLNDFGVRQFELDVHLNYAVNHLEVYHILGIDATTRCAALATCLDEMRRWSEQHPRHAPIVLWIEVKDFTGGRKFKSVDLVDTVLRDRLGDRLVTPAQVKGDFASLNQAVRTRGWPTLGEMRGKFIAVWLNPNETSFLLATYLTRAGDIGDRVMFPRADPIQFNAPWAAIAKLGAGNKYLEDAHERHFLVAANGCMATDDEAACRDTLARSRAAGIHMLGSDKPALISAIDTVSSGGATVSPAVHCNPVTAPPSCDTVRLE